MEETSTALLPELPAPRRFMMQVLDASLTAGPMMQPPHTQSTYLLRATSLHDVDFADAASITSVVIGLPQIGHVDDIQRFCDRHAAALSGVHRILLPGEVSPSQGLLLQALLQRLPEQTRVVCSAYGQALFSNGTFFDGVRRVMAETVAAPTQGQTRNETAALLRFADISPQRFITVSSSGGSAVVLDVEEETSIPSAPGTGRQLLGYTVKNVMAAHAQREKQRPTSHHPSHFKNEPLFFYDPVFRALFVGSTLQRLPWLPYVLRGTSRDVVLLQPPSLAMQRSSGPPSPLAEPWRLVEACDSVTRGLRQVPEVERVMSASYGEITGDVEACIQAVERSCDKMEELRSRLAHRLLSDTSRDAEPWRRPLLKKIFKEVLGTKKSSAPSTEEAESQLLEWASGGQELGRLAACLSYSAMVLPPTKAQLSAARSSENDSPGRADASPLDPSHSTFIPSTSKDAAQLEGSRGVELLQAIFEKKELSSLGKAARRESIDVRVFMAMTEAELKKVFKTTFGVTKRLLLLQEELRQLQP